MVKVYVLISLRNRASIRSPIRILTTFFTTVFFRICNAIEADMPLEGALVTVAFLPHIVIRGTHDPVDASAVHDSWAVCRTILSGRYGGVKRQ